jgi:hypothetical protein
VPPERLLVNFFYAHPVGHATEAFHYCPFVSHAFAIDHPLLERCPDSAARQAAIPPRWDWASIDGVHFAYA